MSPKRLPGERAGLTREGVLDAALFLADRGGLSALSMRRLGVELGVEAMTLYHHVASKEALLDGLVDRLISLATPANADSASWQVALSDFAHSLRESLLRHPNVLPLVASRPAITQHNLRVMETYLRILCAAGFEPGRALDVLYSVTGFVVGHASWVAGQEAKPVALDQHLDDEDVDRYPLLAEAARANSAVDDRLRFDFTVQAMVTGFESALASDRRDREDGR